MKKIAPLILMISTSSTALACGDSSDYTAMQIAFAIMLIFIGLAAFIIPASILLFNKAINIRGLFLLLSIVFSLVLVSILLLGVSKNCLDGTMKVTSSSAGIFINASTQFFRFR
ncbi:MAG: hypothetical protein GY928_23970 [Colwellia sp.]|nr:hypothetical protein [Colwellia sp.]